METKEVLRTLRMRNGLSQDELAEKEFVTRQAVSLGKWGDDAQCGDIKAAFEVL